MVLRVTKEIFESHKEAFFYQVGVELFADESAFLSEFEQMDKIKSLNVKLLVSNPNLRDTWKDIYDELKEAGIDSSDEKIKAQKIGGFDPAKLPQYLRKKLFMAIDGYGKADAVGIKNGVEQEISKQREAVKEKVARDINESERITILKTVFQTLKSIFLR
jgi:hypothetical protein